MATNEQQQEQQQITGALDALINKRNPNVNVALAERRIWASMLTSNYGVFGLAERITNDLVNMNMEMLIKLNTGNPMTKMMDLYEEQILNDLFFTTNNLRQIRKWNYFNFSLGNALATYEINPQDASIVLQIYDPMNFIPRYDSFGNVTDVAVKAQIQTQDPNNPTITILKYLTSGETFICYKQQTVNDAGASDWSWVVSDRMGVRSLLFFTDVENYLLQNVTPFHWEITDSTIIDPLHLYSPYNKSVFHKKELLDEIEFVFRMMHKDIVYSEKIIMVDRVTYNQLKAQNDAQGANDRDWGMDNINTFGSGKNQQYGVKFWGNREKLAGIFKCGGLRDEIAKEIDLSFKAPQYAQVIDWLTNKSTAVAGVGPDFYTEQDVKSDGAMTATEAQIRRDRQLSGFLSGYRRVMATAMRNIAQDAFMNLPQETQIPQMVSQVRMQVEFKEDNLPNSADQLQQQIQALQLQAMGGNGGNK